MNIYVASSWKNEHQSEVVSKLREAGHEVYDFKNNGFNWADIDRNWREWSPQEFNHALTHPIAGEHFTFDMDALEKCDACLLVTPCGRSAHLELGYAVGAGKLAIALVLPGFEVELMYRMLDSIVYDVNQLIQYLKDDEEFHRMEKLERK